MPSINANVALSRAIDGLLPASLRRDGNRTFLKDYAPRAIQAGTTVYDLGGGSQPFVSLDVKERFGLRVVGLDISAEEMAQAPAGVYDRMIAADLCTYIGKGDADIVMCQATLEHVPDGAGAMRAIASVLKPGGRVFIFAPSRNALFARLNLILPQRVKEKSCSPSSPKKAQGHDGFPAFLQPLHAQGYRSPCPPEWPGSRGAGAVLDQLLFHGSLSGLSRMASGAGGLPIWRVEITPPRRSSISCGNRTHLEPTA